MDSSSKDEEVLPLPEFTTSNKRKHLLSPVIKLPAKETYGVLKGECDLATIPLRYLVGSNGSNTRALFNRIIKKGSLAYHLESKTPTLLSSIMPDKAINGLTWTAYGSYVNALKPTCFMTMDFGTYISEDKTNAAILNHSLKATEYLLKTCKDSIPIGLINGCTIEHVTWHSKMLSDMGIKIQVLNVGDYVHKNNRLAKNLAPIFARKIRENADYLLIYGVGSAAQFSKYIFANGFITNTHYINGLSGNIIISGKIQKTVREPSEELVTQNFRDLKNCLSKLDNNTSIDDLRWDHQLEKETVLTPQ